MSWAPLQGFFLFAYTFTVYRILMVKFPMDLLAVFYYCYVFLGFSLGLFCKNRHPALPKRMLSLSVLVFIFCCIFNQNITVHYLLGNAYYPYPKPYGHLFYLSLLFLYVVLSPLIPFYIGLKTSVSPKNLAAFFLGGALGVMVSHKGILTLTAPYYLALLLIGIFRNKKVLCAGISCIFILYFFLPHKNVFFLWRIKDYTILSSQWTPYYKVDFISFNKNQCLGGVHNTLMLWYVCKDTSLLENEVRQVQKVLAPYAKSVLNMGRVDGVNPLLFKEQGAKIKKIVAVELDPLVQEKVKKDYSSFNKNIFQTPHIESISSDIRYYLQHAKEKFDIVHLNGNGIRLYTYPLSFIPYENYLYTKESYKDIFKKVLKSDGLLVMDWGSSNLEEVYPLVANLPRGIYFNAYWTTFTNYPMLGLPVFFVFASRSKMKIQDIGSSLNMTGHFKEIHVPPLSALYHFNDSRPFVQRALYFILLFFSLPLALIFVVCLSVLGRNFNLSREQLYQGVFFGVILAYVLSRDSRYFSMGPAFGHPFVNTAFFIFLSAGYMLVVPSFNKHKAFLLTLLFGVFMFLHQSYNNEISLWLLAPAALLYGCILRQKVPSHFAEFFLGIPIGIYVFQFLLVLGGYWGVVLFLAVALIFWGRTKL